MILAHTRAVVPALLAALIACLALFGSGDLQRANAGAPNPCDLVTEGEAIEILGTFALSEPPEYGEFMGIQVCNWRGEADEFGHSPQMGVHLFSGTEAEADFYYDATIAPYEEEIDGLGDRAKWVSQVILEHRMWSELRIRAGQYYISIYVDIFEPEFKFSLTEAQAEMLELAKIILSQLQPRAPVEFTQAIQVLQDNYELAADLALDKEPPVPIIAGKPAVARVYFDEDSQGETRTVELSNVASASATVAVGQGCTVEKQRMQQDGCESADLYFTPPVGEWTAGITIKNGQGDQIDHMEFTIASIDTPPLRIGYIPVCVRLISEDPLYCPEAYTDGPVTGLLSKIYPTAPSEFVYERINVPPINLGNPVMEREGASVFSSILRQRWEMLVAQAEPNSVGIDQMFGWLPSGGSFPVLGRADPTEGDRRVAWGIDSSVVDPRDTEFIFAHEVGHNLELRHIGLPDSCNAQEEFTIWPYADSTIQEVGFDVADKAAVAADKKDLMSYCSPPGSNIWISPFSFETLADEMVETVVLTAGVSDQSILIRGTAQADGSSATIESAYVLESRSPPPPSDPGGNHCLRFTGAAAPDYCFDLTFEDVSDPEPLESESFVVRALLPPGTTKVTLLRDNDEMAVIEKSASAPTIEITQPQAGAQWSGEETIEWTANDVEGGALSVAVLYSADGGASWLPIEVDATGSQFAFDTSFLTGDEIMVRVLASDGLNTSDATVGSIAVQSGTELIWGDHNCSGAADPIDGLLALRFNAGLSTNTGECPNIGQTVEVGSSTLPWGDTDCDGQVGPIDSLKTLRHDSGLPVDQTALCPAIGSVVLVRLET